MPVWTKEQETAIYEKGKNIIVSAGAGSGKTAVLSERVLTHLKNNIHIDNLLILTFTKAAAAEMKERIRKKISETPSLHQELDKVDSADITTFDAYALKIVKKYSYLLNISKNISIIDSSIITITKQKILEEMFDNYYKEKEPDFLKLIDDFCLKDDKEIFKAILSLNDKLDNIYNKREYLENYLENNFTARAINSYIDEYVNLIKEKINSIKNQIHNLSFYAEGKYLEKVEEALKPLINSTTYEEIRLNSTVSMPRVPSKSPNELKLIKGEISDLIKEIGNLTKDESEEVIKQNILKTKDYIKTFIKIILELDEKVSKYKKENNAYEFIDISLMAIKLLEDNASIREELKNKYNEILIDEYQDTNDLQDLFISYIENNNVYMVGDVKQSIYRFRNTNPMLFKEKYDNYSKGNGGFKIDLNKNFRSRNEVIHSINEIFNLLMNDEIGGADYINAHQMIFGNTAYDNVNKENYKLKVLNYEKDKDFSNEEIEIFTIANDIKNKIENEYKIMDKETNEERKITYDDFVILIDRSSSFEQYRKIFEYLNIPLAVYKDETITDDKNVSLIKHLYNIIISIYNKNYDALFKYSLMSIMRSFLCEISDEEIFDTITCKDYRNTVIYQKCYQISKKLDNLTNEQLFNIILEEFDFYENINKVGSVKNNIVLLDYLQKIAINADSLGYTPFDFLDYLNEISERKLDIKLPANKEINNAVKIMTIHGSKGLEYPICYFAGLYKRFNIDDLKQKFYFSKDYGFVFPYVDEIPHNTIIKTLLKNKYLEEEISEKIRLFYVALTRAREKMIAVLPLEENILASKDNGVINDEVRKKYMSFKDMLDSVYNVLTPYIKDVDKDKLNLTKDYLKKKKLTNDYEVNDSEKIIVNELNIKTKEIESAHFSKEAHALYSKDDKHNIDLGLRMHSLFELINFENPDYSNMSDFEKTKIQKFIDTGILKGAKEILKEYEFIYEDDKEYHGIIDLLLIFDNHAKIVDYKLKNTKDDAYIKQLTGYKNYISNIINKPVQIYLYSILDEQLVRLDNDSEN